MSRDIHANNNKREIPAPVYAAAGAGEVAYQQLRKLPEAAARTWKAAGESASSLRERVAALDLQEDVERLRDAAQRNAAAVVASAAAVPDKAAARYRELVARGERLVEKQRASRSEVVRTKAESVPVTPAELEAAAAEARRPVTARDGGRPATTPRKPVKRTTVK